MPDLDDIKTERLLLRPLNAADAPAVLDIFGRIEVARWSGNSLPITTIEQAQERIERYQERGGGRPGQGVFGAVPLAQKAGPVIGTLQLVPLPASAGVDRTDSELGWHFHPDVWGRGYATEGGRALIERAWAYGLSEVYAVTRLDNYASQAVCRRLGMEELGVRTDWYDTEAMAFRTTRCFDSANQ